jgi:hypothetical protein
MEEVEDYEDELEIAVISAQRLTGSQARRAATLTWNFSFPYGRYI